jgi:hypothetical protein
MAAYPVVLIDRQNRERRCSQGQLVGESELLQV